MERFDAALVVDLVEAHAVTTFTATPTMLQRIADLPDVDERDFSSLVWVLQGAAVIPPSLVHRWIELLGAERLYMAYGMTEGVGLAAIRGDEWLARPGSVGRGYRDTEVSIRDPDGNELPPGEIGDIYMRSPTSGLYIYLGGAPRLPEAPDGFGTAGDLGFVDADGFLTIVDRRVDLIISGGANVYPAEVESALIDHPAIADVVVVGLSDPEWGRRVHAIVAPDRPRGAADRRRGHRLRPHQVGALQGAQDRRARRRHPAQRGDQGEPPRARRRPRWLREHRPSVRGPRLARAEPPMNGQEKVT